MLRGVPECLHCLSATSRAVHACGLAHSGFADLPRESGSLPRPICRTAERLAVRRGPSEGVGGCWVGGAAQAAPMAWLTPPSLLPPRPRPCLWAGPHSGRQVCSPGQPWREDICDWLQWQSASPGVPGALQGQEHVTVPLLLTCPAAVCRLRAPYLWPIVRTGTLDPVARSQRAYAWEWAIRLVIGGLTRAGRPCAAVASTGGAPPRRLVLAVDGVAGGWAGGLRRVRGNWRREGGRRLHPMIPELSQFHTVQGDRAANPWLMRGLDLDGRARRCSLHLDRPVSTCQDGARLAFALGPEHNAPCGVRHDCAGLRRCTDGHPVRKPQTYGWAIFWVAIRREGRGPCSSAGRHRLWRLYPRLLRHGCEARGPPHLVPLPLALSRALAAAEYLAR
eukprot:scaffold7218_cov613-Prasinococcus_capsulatus_cf.AAC.7